MTVHEFGHQYFYGLLASNEFEEPWLDEGFNSYMTARVLKHEYGDARSYLEVFGVRFPLGIDVRLPLDDNRRYFAHAMDDPLGLPSWKYIDRDEYGALVYSKTALALATIERLVGTPAMDQALRLYSERWRFRHPKTSDFIACLSEVTGRDTRWLFDRTFFSSGTVDYAVAQATSEPARRPRGLFDKDGKLVPAEPAGLPHPRGYDTNVVVRREGDVALPVDVLLRFEGGHTYRSHWDGEARWKSFRVASGPRLFDAVVDPDEKILLDADRTNNGRRPEPDPRAASRWTARAVFWLAESLRLRDGGLVSGPSALVCFGRGLRASLSKPYLGLSLWLIQLLLAAALILPISNSLHANLDHSTIADRMVGVPDYGWWETFRRTHPDILGTFGDAAEGLLSVRGIEPDQFDGLRGVGASAFSLALLAIFLHAFALGGVLGALREPSSSLVAFGREGMRRLPAFLAFTLAAFAGSAAAYRWIYVESGRALEPRVQELSTEGAALAVTGLRLLALLVALAAIKLARRLRPDGMGRPAGSAPRLAVPHGTRRRHREAPTPLRRAPRLRPAHRRPLRRLDRPRSARRRRGALRARPAHPDAAGLRLRPMSRQGRLLRGDLRGADARALARVFLRRAGSPSYSVNGGDR